jgi:prolipoprotein diacylglyceryltransferase
MFPDGFQLGPLFIRFYGIILMTGALAGGWLAARELKRRGSDPEIVWDLLIWLIIGGVIGARLWHVFTPSPSALVPDPVTGEMVNPYFAGGTVRFLDILSIWKGGLGIPGAVIGGLVVGVLENLSGGYLSRVFGGGVKEVAPFVFLVLILMVKPYGLFGTEEIERV